MKKAKVYWFTGLSGSGKTTIANEASRILAAHDKKVKIYDGDIVRNTVTKHLGFDLEHIRENNKVIADLCLKEIYDYDYIFVPVISPFKKVREMVRQILGDSFNLVYVKVSLEEAMRRDPKGLYGKALSGEIKNFIGISEELPYQPPPKADLVIDTEKDDVNTCVNRLVDFVSPSAIFIESLTSVSSILFILPYLIRLDLKGRKKNQRIYFIDASRTGLFITRLFLPLFGMSADKLEFKLIDIRDNRGILIGLRISYFDFSGISKEILRSPLFEQVLCSPAVTGRMPIFLEKQLAALDYHTKRTIWRALFIIHVAEWKMKKEMPESGKTVFFVDRRIWMDEIKRYASRHNVDIISVPKAGIFRDSLLYQILKHCVGIFRYAYFKKRTTEDRSVKLAVQYHGHLNLRYPELHSDLFFWQQSSLDARDILIMYNMVRDPLDKEKWAEITAHQMKAVVFSPKAKTDLGIPIYYHLPRSFRVPLPEFKSKDRGNFEERNWFSMQIRDYYKSREYWHDFFEEYNIRLYVSWYKYNSEHYIIRDAMQEVGGVTTMYQRAFEELSSASTAVSCDVFFGFSSIGAEVERGSGSRIPYYVSAGYIGDYRFPLVKKEAGEVRDNLMRSGARHIIAFFDENSSADPRWHEGHGFRQENYRFLLEKVLNEPSIGLVLKPKASSTLRPRLGPVADLLKRAEATGRCFVFEGGVLHNSYPPAVAALASDVAIHGNLCAVTAGVESALAGVPTLLLDREGWPVSRFYNLGKDKVVFTDWKSLWMACEEFWKSGKKMPGFGDWSSTISELDTFRDGRAAERIGTYLKWILEGFKAGLSRDTVMADAAERYRKTWGNDKIVEVKGRSFENK